MLKKRISERPGVPANQLRVFERKLMFLWPFRTAASEASGVRKKWILKLMLLKLDFPINKLSFMVVGNTNSEYASKAKFRLHGN
jgi:hypothetical protein